MNTIAERIDAVATRLREKGWDVTRTDGDLEARQGRATVILTRDGAVISKDYGARLYMETIYSSTGA